MNSMNRQPRQIAFVLLAMVVAAGSQASADPIAYGVNLFAQFGRINLVTGAFQPLSNLPEGTSGLATGHDGNFYTLGVDGALLAINPLTGANSIVGATGLTDCTTPASPCGPNAANTIASLGSALYATDFANNLYSVNLSTGRATLIGATGIAGMTTPPFSVNPDGSTNLFDESFFSANDKLFLTFDSFQLAADGFTTTTVTTPNLYEIDPATAAATLIGPVPYQLLSAGSINGTVYAIQGSFNAANPFPGEARIVTLDVRNGTANPVTPLDPAAGPVFGLAAAPVPEPSSMWLAGLGFLWMAGAQLRRRHGALERQPLRRRATCASK